MTACSDCPAVLSRRNKTGRCRSCALRHTHRLNPGLAREKGRRLSERFANDAEFRDRQIQASQERLAAWRATDEGRRTLLRTAAHANAVHARSATAWLPDDRRTEYVALRKSLGSREAKRVIMADLTPHERALARLRDGATLSVKPVAPRTTLDFTAGGVATGMLG